jgi:hypothetical protein
MNASFIDPMCAVPIYLLENEDIATHCGKLGGYVFSAILSVLIIGVSLFLYYKKEKDSEGKIIEKPKKPVNHILCTLLIISLLWLTYPLFMGWVGRMRWRGYNEQLKSYGKKGFTTTDAVKQIQDLQEARIQASAITSGAATMAQAIENYTIIK